MFKNLEFLKNEYFNNIFLIHYKSIYFFEQKLSKIFCQKHM